MRNMVAVKMWRTEGGIKIMSTRSTDVFGLVEIGMDENGLNKVAREFKPMNQRDWDRNGMVRMRIRAKLFRDLVGTYYGAKR